MSSLVRIVAVCILIFVLIRSKLNVGAVMILASLSLGLVYRVSPRVVWSALGSPQFLGDTGTLLLSVWAVVLLETVLSASGLFKEMAEAVSDAVGDPRVAMAALPMMLGFLPAAGGAYLSAPLVDTASGDAGYSGEQKAFVNYWYRHVSEYVVPLFPAVIVAAQMAHVSVRGLVVGNLLLGATALLVGWPVLRRGRALVGQTDTLPAQPSSGTERKNKARAWRRVAAATLPVTGSVVLVLALDLPVWVAVTCVALVVAVVFRITPRLFVNHFNTRFMADASLLVLGVMVFRQVFDCAHAAQPLTDIAAVAHISGTSVALMCAFLVTFATGVTTTGIAVALPMALALSGLAAPGGGGLYHAALPITRAVYVASMSGNMLSPAHLCMLLTIKYFGADYWKVYARVWPAQAAVAGVAYLLLAASI